MIHKNIIYLGVVSFFTDMASSMVTTLLPLFVVYVLHESIDKLGIVIAIATFVSYALRILSGYLSERLGIVKPFVVAGYAISAVTKPLLAFCNSYASVAALRALERFGKALRSAPKDALISAYAKKSQEGKTFGFHKMLDIAGELVGALIVFMFFFFSHQEESLIRTIFLWTLLPGAIGVFIVLFLVQDAPAKPREKAIINQEDFRLFSILFLYFFYLLFLFSDQYFIVKAKEVGFSLFTIPLLVIVFTLTQTLTSCISGVLIDKFGVYWMLCIAFSFGFFSIVALFQNFLWIAFIFLGLFTVVSLNALRSYIAKQAKSKAFLYGILYGGIAIFGASGAYIIGFLWENFGFGVATSYSLTGLGILTCVALLFAILKGKKDQNMNSRRYNT